LFEEVEKEANSLIFAFWLLAGAHGPLEVVIGLV
jgi:hypothetical protein